MVVTDDISKGECSILKQIRLKACGSVTHLPVDDIRPFVKSAYQEINFHISQPKHICCGYSEEPSQ